MVVVGSVHSSCAFRPRPPPSEKSVSPNLVIHVAGAVKTCDMGPNIVTISRDLDLRHNKLGIPGTFPYQSLEAAANILWGLPSCRCSWCLCCSLSERIITVIAAVVLYAQL